MSQCVRDCFDGDANADSFCCERMASVVEMPFQPYASADALEMVLYCCLRQIPFRFVCENKSELIVPTITCFELPFSLLTLYVLQMFHYFGRGRNLSLLAVFCFHEGNAEMMEKNYVIMDMEWIDCYKDVLCPTQLAAMRVDGNWKQTDMFSSLVAV